MHSFVPATNAFAKQGVHRFALKNAAEVEQFVAIEGACRALLPIIDALANEHMLSSFTDTSAPKSLSELYVATPLKAITPAFSTRRHRNPRI